MEGRVRGERRRERGERRRVGKEGGWWEGRGWEEGGEGRGGEWDGNVGISGAWRVQRGKEDAAWQGRRRKVMRRKPIGQ